MIPTARRARAIEQLRPVIERARRFSGWNFDDVGVTPLEPQFPNGLATPWDYVATAREEASRAARVIDLGTGGGEVYSRIALPGETRFIASEEWHINAPVARDRLAPLAVDVVRASSEITPWAEASFDVVLSRHEAIVPEEIIRILRPGGVFVTQQVGKEQWRELESFFPNRTVFPDHFVEYRRAFEAAGLAVTAHYHTWHAAYATLGDIAYMLLVAPWEVPGFDPVRDIDRLLALEDAHGGDQGIVMTLCRYLMVARMPGRR